MENAFAQRAESMEAMVTALSNGYISSLFAQVFECGSIVEINVMADESTNGAVLVTRIGNSMRLINAFWTNMPAAENPMPSDGDLVQVEEMGGGVVMYSKVPKFGYPKGAILDLTKLPRLTQDSYKARDSKKTIWIVATKDRSKVFRCRISEFLEHSVLVHSYRSHNGKIATFGNIIEVLDGKYIYGIAGEVSLDIMAEPDCVTAFLGALHTLEVIPQLQEAKKHLKERRGKQ
jgi:hypothetical protein